MTFQWSNFRLVHDPSRIRGRYNGKGIFSEIHKVLLTSSCAVSRKGAFYCIPGGSLVLFTQCAKIGTQLLSALPSQNRVTKVSFSPGQRLCQYLIKVVAGFRRSVGSSLGPGGSRSCSRPQAVCRGSGVVDLSLLPSASFYFTLKKSHCKLSSRQLPSFCSAIKSTVSHHKINLCSRNCSLLISCC